jgi:lysophospholipase L1-like esterase
MRKTLIAGGLVLLILGVLVAGYLYAMQKATRLPRNNPQWYLENTRGTREGAVVVLAGDSLTHGGVSANYVDLLAERPAMQGYTLVNAGINAQLAYHLVLHLDEIAACEPDYVTILIGTNDANSTLHPDNEAWYVKTWDLPQRPDAEWYRANLTTLIVELQTRTDAEIDVLSLPTIGEDPDTVQFERTQTYSTIVKEIAEETRVTYLPLQETMSAYLRGHPANEKYEYRPNSRLQTISILKHHILGQSYNQIGAANGFVLHSDFLHLNESGAAMVADLIEGFVTE